MLDPDDFLETWQDGTPAGPEFVMVEWMTGAARQLPWRAMPLDDRSGRIRSIVDELLDLGSGIESSLRRGRIERTAREHGEYRRGQGCPEAVVVTDFLMLRQSIRDAFRATGAPARLVRQATRHLLPDWHLARRAARAGFAHALVRRGDG